jgi:hypothetical protein
VRPIALLPWVSKKDGIALSTSSLAGPQQVEGLGLVGVGVLHGLPPHQWPANLAWHTAMLCSAASSAGCPLWGFMPPQMPASVGPLIDRPLLALRTD